MAKLPERVKPGDPISAVAFNQMRDELVRLQTIMMRAGIINSTGNYQPDDAPTKIVFGEITTDPGVDSGEKGKKFKALRRNTSDTGWETIDGTEREGLCDEMDAVWLKGERRLMVFQPSIGRWTPSGLNWHLAQPTACIPKGGTGNVQIMTATGGSGMTAQAGNPLGPTVSPSMQVFIIQHPQSRQYYILAPPNGTPIALEDCKGIKPTAYSLSPSLAGSVGSIFKIGGTCYTVRCITSSEGDSAGALPLISGAITGPMTDCSSCSACWKLDKCGGGATKYTNIDLSQWENKTVKETGTGICWNVTRATDCSSADTFAYDVGYSDCTGCGKCYYLSVCYGTGGDKILKNDLAALSGLSSSALVSGQKVFKIRGRGYKVYDYSTCTNDAYTESDISYTDNCTSTGCYKLTECNPEHPSSPDVKYVTSALDHGTDTNLGDIMDQLVRLDNGKCYSIARETNSTNCGGGNSVNIQESYKSCDLCKCYKLLHCGDNAATVTYVDLAGLGFAVGGYIKDESDNCFKIDSVVAWTSGAVDFKPTEKKYGSCDGCNLVNKYKLVNDCNHEDCPKGETEAADAVITNADIGDSVNKWFKINDKCYRNSGITTDANDTVTESDIGNNGPFETCEDCIAAKSTGSKSKRYGKVKIKGTQLVQEVDTVITDDSGASNACKAPDVVITDLGDCSGTTTTGAQATTGGQKDSQGTLDPNPPPGVVTETWPGQGTWQYTPQGPPGAPGNSGGGASY